MKALKKHLHLPCACCALKFCNTDDLNKHLAYSCAECQAKFCTETALEKHIFTHSAEPDSCGIIQGRIDLTGGIDTNENGTEHRHEPDIEIETIGNKCHFCDKQFYTEEYLQKHILRRHGEQQRDCEQLTSPSPSVNHPENNHSLDGSNTTDAINNDNETDNSEDTPQDLSINNAKEVQHFSNDKVDNVNSTHPDNLLKILTSSDNREHPKPLTSVICTVQISTLLWIGLIQVM